MKKTLCSEAKEKINQNENFDLNFATSLFNEVFLETCNNCSDSQQQKSICADLIYYYILNRLDSLNKRRMGFSLGELYQRLSIPKEFLDT